MKSMNLRQYFAEYDQKAKPLLNKENLSIEEEKVLDIYGTIKDAIWASSYIGIDADIEIQEEYSRRYLGSLKELRELLKVDTKET